MAALNPYSRDNSTRMPIGEPKRNDEIISKYRPEGFDNEVEGVVFAMLMQYAKTDSSNAEKRARQFAKILYEYSARLINDLDVSNSVIAQKITNAIDSKVAAELTPLGETVDFETEISDVKKTVSDYLSSLISVANGNRVTSKQLGLSSKESSTSARQTALDATATAIPNDFIELIRRECKDEPDMRSMPVAPHDLTVPIQTLAKNANTFFDKTITTFTNRLASRTVERLHGIQKTISAFGANNAKDHNVPKVRNEQNAHGSGMSDSHQVIKQAVKTAPNGEIFDSMNKEMLAMEEEQDKEKRNTTVWTTRIGSLKKQLDSIKHTAGVFIDKSIKFAAMAFHHLSDGIKTAYKKVKKSSFIKFLLSPAGILVFGLLGYAGYKLIFGGIGAQVKKLIVENVFNRGVDAGVEELNKKTGKDDTAKQNANEENSSSSFLNVFANEYDFYASLDISKDGWGNTGDKVTDHWLENIKKIDEIMDRAAKATFGMTIPDWLEGLGKDNGNSKQTNEEGGFIAKLKKETAEFKEAIGKFIASTADWIKSNEVTKSIANTWNAISTICKTMYSAMKPVVKAAIKFAPLIGSLTTIFHGPVGIMIKGLGKFGKALVNSPLGRIIGNGIVNLFSKNPFLTLLLVGLGIGLTAIGTGIWNVFDPTPNDNGYITPKKMYAAGMGLAEGQEDKHDIHHRLMDIDNLRRNAPKFEDNKKEWANAFEKHGGLTSEEIKFMQNGIERFDQNYANAMANQDGNNPKSLHWFVLNRAKDSTWSNSDWGRILSEIPILGIGPGLVHKDLYENFKKSLDSDSKYNKRSEVDWLNVRTLLMRMRNVDTVFRNMFDMASPKEIKNFIENVNNANNSTIENIYTWTHNSEPISTLNEYMKSMFGTKFVERINALPKIDVTFYDNKSGLIDFEVAGSKRHINIPVFDSSPDKTHEILNTFFGGMSNGIVFNPDALSRRGQNSSHTVTGINPQLAAHAFVNYMRRPTMDLFRLDPWKFNESDRDNLSFTGDDGEHLYKLKDIVRNTGRKNINDITSEHIKNAFESKYKDLPRDADDKDSQTIAGVVYVLGTILQMCDDIDHG